MWHWRTGFSGGAGLILKVFSNLNVSMIPGYPAIQGNWDGWGWPDLHAHTPSVPKGEVEQTLPLIPGCE